MQIINGMSVIDKGMRYPKEESKKKQRYYDVICDCSNTREIMGMTLKKATEKILCKQCSRKINSENKLVQSITNFFITAQNIHKDKYNYKKVDYVDSVTPVILICSKHGEFTQTPRDHLQGKGCKKCAIDGSRYTNTEFVDKLNSIHKGTIVPLSSYEGIFKKIKMKCQCEHEWEPTPSSLLKGTGCPVCAVSGYKVNKPGKLYYLKIKNKDSFVYKIGITNLTVHKRLNYHDRDKVVASVVWSFKDGQEAYDREQTILERYKDFKYEGPPVLKSGNTELFIKDIGGYFSKDIHDKTNN